MHTLLLLFILCGLGGIVIGINTNLFIGYIAYNFLIALAIFIFIGVSALFSHIAPKTKAVNTYYVLQLTDDTVIINTGQGHSLSLSRGRVNETIMSGEICPKLEITTFNVDDTFTKWFVPVCLPSDIWTLYI